MQRYEREVNEILRDLGCDTMPSDPQLGAGGSQSGQNAGNDVWQHQDAHGRRGGTPLRPRTRAERAVAGACLVLAMALPLLLYGSGLSAALILLTLALLLVSLKYSRRTGRTGDDLDAKDLRWKDVTVQARQDTPGTPRKRDDSFWST